MKQVLHLLSIVILCSLLNISCSKDDESNPDNELIVGVWAEQEEDEYHELFVFTFLGDNTGSMNVYSRQGTFLETEDSFTYTFDKKTMRLVVTFYDHSDVYKVNVMGNRMSLEDEDGWIYTLFKR